MPKVSVIIPTYKARETIAKTLHSIAAQSIAEDIEVIIADDADGESYEDIIGRFANLNIKFVEQLTNGGCGLARNFGMCYATTNFVCFIVLLHRNRRTLLEAHSCLSCVAKMA